jgi:1-acyl-sn-glycerol-3-phosphate acyltransferase
MANRTSKKDAPSRGVLGNDPFLSGAAVRPPVEPAVPVSSPDADVRPADLAESAASTPPSSAASASDAKAPNPAEAVSSAEKSKRPRRPTTRSSRKAAKSASDSSRPSSSVEFARVDAEPESENKVEAAVDADADADADADVETKRAPTIERPYKHEPEGVTDADLEIDAQAEEDDEEGYVDEADQSLMRKVLIPEVETDDSASTPPMEQEQTSSGLGAWGRLRQLASGPAKALMGRVASSPTALNVAAATISGVSAVRSLMTTTPQLPSVDEFGEDPALVERAAPAVDFFYRHYWRVSVEGRENLPRAPLLAICNHSGALPLDGLVVRSALERTLENQHARWLVEDGVFHMPFLGTWLNRLGAVRACPENATRLLEEGRAVVVFPEGLWGLRKTWRKRYQLQRFGRGGFVKLALKTGAPLVPTAVVGAEEAMPLLATLPARPLGMPYVPLTPTFPLLGPLGLVPLPAKWTVAFGEPIDLSEYGPDDAQDLALVQRITEEVRERIHAEIERVRSTRSSAFRS